MWVRGLEILGVVALLVQLLGGFQWALNEWRLWRARLKQTGKWLGLTVAACLLPTLAEAACSGSSPTWTAADTSRTEVGLCYTAASNGDTINIPAGSSTWDTELVVTKALTFQGAGTSSTLLTRGTIPASQALFKLEPSTDIAQRVTGIGFVYCGSETGPAAWCIYMVGAAGPTSKNTKQRVDHNTFNKGNSGAVRIDRNMFGLIDHNTFTNGQSTIYLTGIQSPGAWNTSWCNAFVGGDRVGSTAGTADAAFIEDNTIIVNNDVDTNTRDATIYSNGGSRYVIRNNIFDATAYTTKSFHTLLTNDHANQNYYADQGGLDTRGNILVEYYNNVATCHNCDEFFSSRGGSALIWGNVLSRTVPSSNYIQLTEEEGYQTIFFSPLDTVWPAEDQIFNYHIWNNTCQGAACAVSLPNPADPTFIQQDRDFYMHEPQSSGGHEYFDNRCGAAGNGSDGTMLFSASGANAYYPYTPYTYPHPLQGQSTPAVIARTIRWMEVLLPIHILSGLGWHFRKSIIACSLAGLAWSGTVVHGVPQSYERVNAQSRHAALKIVTVINDAMKPRV